MLVLAGIFWKFGFIFGFSLTDFDFVLGCSDVSMFHVGGSRGDAIYVLLRPLDDSYETTPFGPEVY